MSTTKTTTAGPLPGPRLESSGGGMNKEEIRSLKALGETACIMAESHLAELRDIVGKMPNKCHCDTALREITNRLDFLRAMVTEPSCWYEDEEGE